MTTAPVGGYSIDVDDDALQRGLLELLGSIDDFMTLVAREYADTLADEGEQYSGKLGDPWTVSGIGPTERHVTAPEAAWYAHIIAHGARAHGPRTADRLIFAIDGEVVSVDTVPGYPATHFDTRAWESMRFKVDALMARLVSEAEH